MEDSKNLLNELLLKLDNKSILNDIEQINLRLKTNTINHNNSKEVLNDALNLLTRKNHQLESEVQQLSMIQTRNNEQYNKKNGERLKLAKRLIDLEQKNEELESQIAELEIAINKREEDIQKINVPSSEELFFEIAKGFGVEFVTKNHKVIAKVRNKEKNDMFTVEVAEGNIKDNCERIWALMD